MRVFIYHDRTADGHCDDVAVVRAKDIKEAKAILGKYYNGSPMAKIREIDLQDKDLPEIEIISDY